MTDRPRLDDLTSDQYDALCAELGDARREVAALHVQMCLRTCLWPGCMRQMDLTAHLTGDPPARPEWSGASWQMYRGLLPGPYYACPNHAPLIGAHMTHTARGDDGVLTAVCTCGWQASARRWHRVARALWEEHLLTVADDAAAMPAHDTQETR